MEIERRGIEGITVEERSGQKVIEGYAIVFNSRSEDLGGFYEYIDPAALNNTDLSDVVALYNHNSNIVLGRSTSGTLKMEKDGKGLKYTITLPNTIAANDVYEGIKRGDIKGSSFAFSIDKNGDSWSKENGKDKRVIKSIKRVIDVGPVVYPAYTETTAAKRSLQEFLGGEIQRDKDLITIQRRKIFNSK